MTRPTLDTRPCVMQIRADLIELIRLWRLLSKVMPRRPEDAKLAQTFGGNVCKNGFNSFGKEIENKSSYSALI